MGKGELCPGFCLELAPGDGTAGGFALGETAAAAGTMGVDAASKGVWGEHWAAFSGMVGETEPTAAIGPEGDAYGDASGGGSLLKVRYFRRCQFEQQGTTATTGLALGHTDAAGLFSSQAGDAERGHYRACREGWGNGSRGGD